jgi:hypothetical protein
MGWYGGGTNSSDNKQILIRHTKFQVGKVARYRNPRRCTRNVKSENNYIILRSFHTSNTKENLNFFH